MLMFRLRHLRHKKRKLIRAIIIEEIGSVRKGGKKARVTMINDYVDTNDDYCKHDEK